MCNDVAIWIDDNLVPIPPLVSNLVGYDGPQLRLGTIRYPRPIPPRHTALKTKK